MPHERRGANANEYDWGTRAPNGTATADAAIGEPRLTIEEVEDPAEVAAHRAHAQRVRRNSQWLQAHWADVLPQARGRFVAVAGQEAFIADSPEAAWAVAEAAHPDDDGVHVQYVFPTAGPRVYAHTG